METFKKNKNTNNNTTTQKRQNNVCKCEKSFFKYVQKQRACGHLNLFFTIYQCKHQLTEKRNLFFCTLRGSFSTPALKTLIGLNKALPLP